MLGVAQSSPVPGDVGANVREHILLGRRAAELQANVVLFPELSLTGYEPELAPQLAFDEDYPRLDPLRRLAEQLSVTLIAGAPLRCGEALHIAALAMMPDGRVELYAKRRLGAFAESARADGAPPPPEARYFTPGDIDSDLVVNGARLALAICADIGDPGHARRAAGRGADGYLASMFVIPSDFDRDAARLAGYAKEHSMVVAMANFGSPSGGLASAGCSSIWNREGELLGQLPRGGSGVIVASAGATSARQALLDGAPIAAAAAMRGAVARP